jgi:hypothetical protein
MPVPSWVWAFGTALIAIPAAIAIEMSRREKRGLGDSTKRTVSPFMRTEMPDDTEEDIDEYGYTKTPEDEDDCLILGKKHSDYRFGKYRVCLTENQKKTLFKHGKGKKLGCGVFACAYGTTPTQVVKFTRDPEDVAALLEAQPLKVVPKVHAVYKLKEPGESIDNGEETPVYALVVERLKPFQGEERLTIDQEIYKVPDMVRIVEAGEYDSIDEVCRAIREEGDGHCSPVTQQTAEAAMKLKDAGIDWTDVHAGNIGLDQKGNVKILDLGVTGTQLREQPKILEGARRRLAKRRLAGV